MTLHRETDEGCIGPSARIDFLVGVLKRIQISGLKFNQIWDRTQAYGGLTAVPYYNKALNIEKFPLFASQLKLHFLSCNSKTVRLSFTFAS